MLHCWVRLEVECAFQGNHLTEDLRVMVVVVLGLQSLQAQLSAACGHSVVNALQAASTVSPQPLQPSRTDGGQEPSGGDDLQLLQRRWGQQQALRDRHRPWTDKHGANVKTAVMSASTGY